MHSAGIQVLRDIRRMPRLPSPVFRVPPPAIFIVAFLVALWMEAAVFRIRFMGDTATPRPMVVAGVFLIAAGASLVTWGMLTFRAAGTTVLPFREPSSFVMSGPYRFTRNPMYAGLTLAHAGGAMALNAGWPILLLPLALVVLYLLVVRGEERQMAATFGAEYEAYKRRVRRWL